MGNPVYVPCHELPEEVELVERSSDDVAGKKICDAGYLTEKHYFLSKEFICETVDDKRFLGGGIAIAPTVVNVIDATVDQNKAMLVQRQYVNFIQEKRPISETSSSESLISFSDADLEGIDHSHNDSLVISLNVKVGSPLGDMSFLVNKILVDPGSAVNVMYIDLFEMLNLKSHLKSTSMVLNGFNNASVQPMGVVMLKICVEPLIVDTEFLVINVRSIYNAIVGRPWLHKMKAVPSTFHQLLKFPPNSGIKAIRGDQNASQQCCMIEVKAKEKAAKIVAASGIADGCMRSECGPIAVFDCAKFAEEEGSEMATKSSVGTLKEADLKGKKVFVKVDLNVPLDDNLNITDDTRVQAAVPTIKYLMGHGAKVILFSHLGPKGVTPKYNLNPIVQRLSELVGIEVKMANDCIGEEVQIMVAEIPEGGVLLLENVRFYKEEEKNDPEFAKKLASLADLYVNDAFGTAHRAHTSTDGVAKYLKPSVAGFPMQKTIVKKLADLSSGKGVTTIIGGSDSVAAVEEVGLGER